MNEYKTFSEQDQKEAEFFDKEYADADARQNQENYIIPESIIRQFTRPAPNPKEHFEYAAKLLGDLRGKKLLDYGAGDGWTAISFAKGGANVSAIDISKVGIELVKKKAAANGVSDRMEAEVQNCYQTRYPTDKFDLIYGGGVLHHLDIETAGQEISRILHPDGTAVFAEPIRDTSVMDIIKKIVLWLMRNKAQDVTEDEEPLTKRRIYQLKPYFRTINIRYFNILSSASVLFNSKGVTNLLLWADHILIKLIPGFKRLGRAVVIELRNPVKKHQ